MSNLHTAHIGSDQLKFRLKTGFGLLVLILLAGSMGYRLIEGWPWLSCFYMTVITISTVGFKEVSTLSPAGQLFTIALIFCGIGSVALTGTSALEWIIDQNTGNLGGKKRMRTMIGKLKDHIIVCGYGRMGRHVVNELKPQTASFVVIERDVDICNSIIEQGMLAIQGDATDESTLTSAGIDKASALVASLNTDADNLYLTLTAHGMRPDLNIIVRAEEQASHAKFMRAGATKVVSPYAIGADHIVQLILRPGVVEFIKLVTHGGALELNIDQTELDTNSPLANKTLSESRARQSLGRMILAVKKKNGATTFDPAPDTMLTPGDVLVTVGRQD